MLFNIYFKKKKLINKISMKLTNFFILFKIHNLKKKEEEIKKPNENLYDKNTDLK